jgi:serine/threonine protein kinase
MCIIFSVMHGEKMRVKWQSASMREKLGLCVDISEGLSHLHAANLLHGDLKSHNVLVGLRQGKEHAGVSLLQAKLKRQLEGWGDADGSLPAREEGLIWVAKLGDLGTVAKIPEPDEPPLVLEIGTAGWMAPEVCWSAPSEQVGEEDNLSSGGYGLSADVWSFGVVLWECFGDHHRMDPFKPGSGLWRGGSNPFAGIAAEDYLRRLHEGERWPLTLTDDDDDVTEESFVDNSMFETNGEFVRGTGDASTYVRALQELAIGCWNLDPIKRPHIHRISHSLHSMADSFVSQLPDPTIKQKIRENVR